MIAWNNGKEHVCWNFPIKKFVKVTYWALRGLEEVQMEMAAAELLSLLDQAKGYHQCDIAEECRSVMTVLVGDEAYQFCAGPFGFPDTGAWHGSMLNEVIRSDKGVGGEHEQQECVPWPVDDPLLKSVVQYRDDIEARAPDADMAIARLDRLLHCFRRHTGTFSEEKTILFVKWAVYTGALVGEGKVVPLDD